MLNKIIHFSLQNRILVLVASVLLLIGGTYTAMHTEVDVFPDLNAPTVVIMTEANGMAAEEVEQLVTFPVETVLREYAGYVLLPPTGFPLYGLSSTGKRMSTWHARL